MTATEQHPTALALAGDPAAALAMAAGQEEAEYRYLVAILIATACARTGQTDAITEALALALGNYRPIVEDGLARLHAAYMLELLPHLDPGTALALVEAMDPEVVALGALSSVPELPGTFLGIYNLLLEHALGFDGALHRASRHSAAHLLLGEMARRHGDMPPLDAALGRLATDAANEAAKLAWKAQGGATPFTREQLRRALVREGQAISALFNREAPSAAPALGLLPMEALASLPRGLRFEAFQGLAEQLRRVPQSEQEWLFSQFLEAILETTASGPLLRRHGPAIARVAGPFLELVPAALDYFRDLLDWFIANEEPLAEGAADEAIGPFARPLAHAGGKAAGALEHLLHWSMATVPGSAPIALAAWCRATGAAPGALEPNWARAPEFAARVLQEAPSEERASWAAEALGGWNLADLLAGEPEVAKAVARVLTLAPEPLANPDLARLASDLVRTSQPDGPCLATLERLGTPTRPDHLALLLEAALGAGEGGGDEHDQALRQIVLRMFEEDPSRALSLAGQFTNPNVVGWLIGNIIASGRAADLPAAEFRALAPHPFLIGAYSLEAP